MSGPQVTTCPPTCSCPEGEPPLKSHFPAHVDEGTWRCPGRAAVVARPGVASSSLTGITLGALLVKDHRHSGWALNRMKHLKNLSLQGFLKQKPWPADTQLENILLDEDSPANCAPTGCGTVASGWMPVYRVQISVRVCHRESDFTTRGTLPWIDS